MRKEECPGCNRDDSSKCGANATKIKISDDSCTGNAKRMMWVTIPAPILGPKQTRTDACHVVIMQLQSGKSIFVVYGDRDDALAATRALRRSHVDSTMRTLVLGGNPINPRSGGQGGAALRGVIARRLGQVDDLMALDPLLVAQSASNRDVETIAAKRAEFGNWCREVDRARIAKSVPSDGTDHG